MELKKSVKADLEWRKPTFLLIGLFVSLLAVYTAFERVGAEETDEGLVIGGEFYELVEEIPITTQPKELPPAPPMPSIFEETGNEVEVPDFRIDVGIDEETVTPEYEYVPIEAPVDVVTTADVPFIVVEDMPKFIGGEEARMKFLKDNIVYPSIARNAGIEGKVVISFVVEPDGRLSNFEVARGTSPSLDAEALRVAKLMPKWEAGKQRGKAVRVKYTMPISFSLN